MRQLAAFIVLSILAVLSVGCGNPVSLTPAAPALADEIIFYGWADYMPQSVLDAFTAEYGVRVRYDVYATEEQAAQTLRAGKAADIVVLPPEMIPGLVADGVLAEIDFRNVPNFRYISANFRELAYDPDNRYSIVFHWGSTGLLVRTDLVAAPVAHWADLWDPRYRGRIALWPIARAAIPIALKSLGYPANSTDPQQLEEALQHLLEIKDSAIWWDNRNPSVIPALVSGEAVVAYGWAYDARVARTADVPISYIFPAEGTFLWSDNFVIPALSQHKTAAELFLNYVLRPEVSAQIVNESFYPMANDAAEPFIDPAIRNDPVIYPPAASLVGAEIIVPLGAKGENLFLAIWDRFQAAGR